MVYGPVGIRCPDHASAGGSPKAPRRVATSTIRRFSWSGPIVTQTLIAINVAVFLIQLFNGADLMQLNTGWIYVNGLLIDHGFTSTGQAIGVGEGGEFYRPMAVAIIGGTITSTLLTLLVVPTWYDSIEIMRERWVGRLRRLFRHRAQAGEPKPAAGADD